MARADSVIMGESAGDVAGPQTRAGPEARLRIAMLTRRPPHAHGGVEHVVRSVTTALAERRPRWSVRAIAAFRRSAGINDVSGIGDLVAGVSLGWRFLRTPADVVFLHCPEAAWGPRLARRICSRSTAMVQVWHGAGPVQFSALAPEGDRRARALAWLRSREQRLALAADAHIAVHEAVVRDLAHHFGFHGPVTVAHNALDRSLLAALAEPPSRVSRDELVVLWVGQTGHLKGLDVTLAACRMARAHGVALKLVIVGMASDGGADEPWIRWCGVLDPARTLHEYRSADLFIFPTRYEAFPIVALEAMAAGLPAIVSGALPEGIIHDGRNGVVIPGHEPGPYADAILELARDPQRRAAIAAVNRRDVRRWDWELTAETYAGVAERVHQARMSTIK